LLASNLEMPAAGEVARDIFLADNLLHAINRGQRRRVHALGALAAVQRNQLIDAQFEAGEDHAAIARTGPPSDGFSLQHGHRRAALRQGTRRGEAGETGADDCDVDGFVDRGKMSLYGHGDHVVGSVPIFGSIEGRGANRFTSRIRGDAEGRAIVEVEARPKMRKDWSLDLNLSDSFHWSEPPVLHVLGRNISLTKYAEPGIRRQLGRLRLHAEESVRRLDLHNKAAEAWAQAFQPIQIFQDPAVWLQMTPASAALAGIHANAKELSGSLELTGTVQTLVGGAPAAVTPTPLPPLGDDIKEPGTFDILLPVRVDYDALRDRVMQVVATNKAGAIIKEVQIYPSSGKLVIGVRVARPSETDPGAGDWLYLSGALSVDPNQQSVRISDLSASSSLPDDSQLAQIQNEIIGQLKEIPSVSYGVAYQNLLNAANERLNRPLKNGFRMEGQLSTAKLESIQLLADGVSIALRVSGELKLLYGM